MADTAAARLVANVSVLVRTISMSLNGPGATQSSGQMPMGTGVRMAVHQAAVVVFERLVHRPSHNPTRANRLRYAPMWLQRELTLEPRGRGFHLVTREVLSQLPELQEVGVGLLHLLIRHTSASLTLNENASPEVRRDFEAWFSDAVPEHSALWTHTLEGSDDMPAHIKASLLGSSLTLPIGGGRLALGTWQGIYLCEHRDHGGIRSLLATVWGEAG